ncbi:MAG: hypothetical protein HQM10_18150 [Candidatus Riflebacteria bacterium]|nr:hypothetical protein [Candidatus Riflebacteria bacterium]
MRSFCLKKNEVFEFIGSGKISVKTGLLEISCSSFSAGKEFELPSGKKLTVMAVEDSEVETSIPEDCVKKSEDKLPEIDFAALFSKIDSLIKPGKLFKIMVLGESTSGKTWFSTILANKLLERSLKTSVLDCDIAQSEIALPGTMALAIPDKTVSFLAQAKQSVMSFVGAHSFGSHLLPSLSAMALLQRKAENISDVLIIDTTSWVHGDCGRAIKKAKMDIFNSDIYVLLQNGNELEHLVKHLPASRIFRNPALRKNLPATPQQQIEKRSFREARLVNYFKNSRVIEIPFSQLFSERSYFLSGSHVNLDGSLWAEKLSGWEGTLVFTSGPILPEMVKSWPKDLGRIINVIAGEEKGLVAGLTDGDQNFLGLCRIEEFDFLKNILRMKTPLACDTKNIKGIQFGSLKISEKYLESGFIEPGRF